MGTIKHAFVNPQADGPDTTVARPSDWNADHVVQGTANTVAKLTGTGITNSSITDDGAGNVVVPGNVALSDITHGIAVNAPLTQTLTIPPGVMPGSNGEINLTTLSGTGHLTATGDIFAYVVRNGVTFDTTTGQNASGGFFSQVTSSRSAGVNALQNKGFEANILNGDVNVAFHSLHGDIIQETHTDAAALGVTSVYGLTNNGGSVDLSAGGSAAVTLGANVQSPVVLPGTSSINAELKVGVTGAGTSGMSIHTKNTNTAAGSFTGIEVAGDTTVVASVRPAYLLWRGAGGGIGGTVEGGLAIASGSGFPFVGMAANDLGLFMEGGGDLYLGADNSTFVPAVKIKSSDNSVTLMNGPLTLKSGNKVQSGSGSPNTVVTGNPGDMYLNTAGGAGTTLYVKESGTGTNTGWVGK